MRRIHCFAPIEDRNAQTLVLGSMPGRASLAAGQYYAHARNAFWPIIAELLRIDAAAPYAARVRALKSARIALWDVLGSCAREGSLDSMIERDTQTPNDFRAFFRTHRNISRVFFNGATAQACFNRHVLRDIDGARVSYARLPSTSPAHAAMSFDDKLAAWRAVMPLTRVRHDPRAA